MPYNHIMFIFFYVFLASETWGNRGWAPAVGPVWANVREKRREHCSLRDSRSSRTWYLYLYGHFRLWS